MLPAMDTMTALTTLTLGDALDSAIRRYRAANPHSERLQARAAEVMPGGNTRSVLFYPPFPLYMASGAGCRLRDVDGHDYLDALGEFTAGLFGHSDPVIRRAIDAALDRGLNLSSHTPGEAALAHEIRRRFPAMELLRFTNSGTEANLLALAAATTHTGRHKVMVFEGAYHGGVLTFGAGSASVNVPHEFVRVAYNDLAAARDAVMRHGRELAAILVEPMLGSGGCIPGTPEFLHGLRALADDCGALLVFDEVMTSRLSIGGRQALLGIGPDLTTLGKYFGGGMSIGVFGGRAELIARFDPRRADALVAVLPLVDTAISTSGDYERFFERDGVRHHHIVDPATGESPRSLRSVTVMAADGLTCEALSKSIFVLGIERGLELVETLEGVDALCVDAEGALHASSGMSAGRTPARH